MIYSGAGWRVPPKSQSKNTAAQYSLLLNPVPQGASQTFRVVIQDVVSGLNVQAKWAGLGVQKYFCFGNDGDATFSQA